MRNLALKYAKRAWSVFPVARNGLEAFPVGLEDASRSQRQVNLWWDRWPDAWVGIATGTPSGFWVLTVDGANGSQSLTRLEEEIGPLPDTMEQETGEGRHICFLWDPECPVRDRPRLRPPGWDPGAQTGLGVVGEGGFIVSHPGCDWPGGDRTAIVPPPEAWLDLALPECPGQAPWKQVDGGEIAEEYRRPEIPSGARAALADAIARGKAAAEAAPAPIEKPTEHTRPFPTELFPEEIARFVRSAAASLGVDESCVALPVLAVAGAASADLLRLKGDLVLPPTLWVALVGLPGLDRSAPARIAASALDRAAHTPRLARCDDLRQWLGGFSRGDGQERLDALGAPAGVTVLGGIRPEALVADVLGPGVNPGLAPRLLVTCPPRRSSFWTVEETSKGAGYAWVDAVSRIANGGVQRVLRPTPDAFDAFVANYNAVSLEIEKEHEPLLEACVDESRYLAGRLALIHHGLSHLRALSTLHAESVAAGVEWAAWCLEEQIRVYGYVTAQNTLARLTLLAARLRRLVSTAPLVSTRQMQRINGVKYRYIRTVFAEMDELVAAGLAQWEGKRKVLLL